MSRLVEYPKIAVRAVRQAPLPGWVYTTGFGKARMATPTGAVLKRHAVDVAMINRTRTVWLDRHKADNGVIVYLHGGAYVSGPFAFDWQWLSDQADRRECAAVLIDYRYAPDYQHPTGLLDAAAVIKRLSADGVLTDLNWILAGQNSGAGLALALADRLGTGEAEKANVPAPRGLVIMSPWWDLELNNTELTETEQRNPVHERRLLQAAASAYAGRTPLDDPSLSPVNADLAALPSIHLSVGLKDIFLTDARIMRMQFERQDLHVDYREVAGKLNGRLRMSRGADMERLLQEQAEFIDRVLA
ncbi:alpha/beta hydrolase [Helcobacillus massiliensis]|uniref:Acetyl esterase/lipase n=1 Tax=Helcobacillus massiliensis TaxID=521392 RepID=A0A839QVF6_9MICO|nr:MULTISPECIES: alpha/beta hydrolase fold domain-containing protein [Helcobacillus]MBB3024003.1 acetyl esterase/lipase [Helcobacillus massiliensis]MBB3024082.1 acetyl esterase/lipase [Helcobacillus massiliensis]MCG7427659.1 alpha/beta hydrolase [Helcobacillus sp. ACRRO]MCT1556727.1 alpha/beta hydrolase [Helcobacillus massiliensis]MCT2035551.1 alpha/beta hydrolase [Helcobacillus massiliensis]